MQPIKSTFKTYTWKHWSRLLWITDPSCFIKEIILGRRMPLTAMVKRDPRSGVPTDQLFIKCPHCKTVHDGSTWSLKHKTLYKNWFGLFCPACQQVIPCLLSLSSIAVLISIAPIYLAFQNVLKKRWLRHQPSRYKPYPLAF